MSDVMGIIYTSKDDLALRELTSQRSVAAIPVAGRYRIIDFTLSNLVNSEVRNVGIIAQKNYRSLMDHIGSAKEWDLHTRNNGLFMLPPFLTRENGGEYSGMVEALRANFDYLRRSQQKYAILTGSDSIMNVSYEPMIKQHIESGADITLMYKKINPTDLDFSRSSNNSHAFIDVDSDGVVHDMEDNPNAASYDNLYLEVMIVKRTLLIHLIDQAVSHGAKSLTQEVLRPFISSGALKVMGYRMNGYYRRIETIKSYFNFNLDLLNYDVRKELFGVTPIYTKTRDEVPAIYRTGAQVKNSLVADGCVIEGTVENSILFRGVHVARGANLKNCIIMQDSYIEEFVELENVILDKEVTVRSHGRMIGQRQYPIVIGKGVSLKSFLFRRITSMKELFAASECVPFVKTGGLADVVGALPKELRKQGVEVRVILPLYKAIGQKWREQMEHVMYFYINMGWRRQYVGILKLEYEGTTFYFIDNEQYFGRDYIYGSGGDEGERFAYFSRAVLEAIPKIDYIPDVLHCHDWQTGMIPVLLKAQYKQLDFYKNIRTVYTIH